MKLYMVFSDILFLAFKFAPRAVADCSPLILPKKVENA